MYHCRESPPGSSAKRILGVTLSRRLVPAAVSARVAVSAAAGARVTGAVGAAVVASVGPQRLVDDEPVTLQRRHSSSDVVRAVLDTEDVTRVVVDEAAQLLAEGRVLPRVEDERVPADVDERGRAVGAFRLESAELQEGQGLIHDAFREETLDGFVLDDPTDESLFELLVDGALVGR